jgi:hypothetical protein
MSTADELVKLHQLLEKGALTQAEFERAKARLLDESPGPGAGLAINRLRRSLADRWIAELDRRRHSGHADVPLRPSTH